jgi:enoyl-CoA hydratase/carnithine racemase
MTDQIVQLDVPDATATITLNRPEVLDALNLPMTEGLVAVVEACRDDDRIRAVV